MNEHFLPDRSGVASRHAHKEARAATAQESAKKLVSGCAQMKLEQNCSAWLESMGLLLDEEEHLDATLAQLISQGISQEPSKRAGNRGANGSSDQDTRADTAKRFAPTVAEINKAARCAAKTLLGQDDARLDRGNVALRGHSQRDRFLVEGLGFSPRATTEVAVRFNGLRPELRRALLGVLVRHRPVQEILKREGAWDSPQALYHEILETLIELRKVGGDKQ